MWPFKKREPEQPDPERFGVGYACEDLHVSINHADVCFFCGKDVRPAVTKIGLSYFGWYAKEFVRWCS